MCKKLIYLTSFVLVLGLVLISVAEAVDPSLVNWWRFDEGSGTIASVSSSYGNDAALGGNATWDEGLYGGSLYVDAASGAGWVDIDPASCTNPGILSEAADSPEDVRNVALREQLERNLVSVKDQDNNSE